MISVKVEITRLMEDAQPGWVECKLVDAYGQNTSSSKKFQLLAWRISMRLVHILERDQLVVRSSNESLSVVSRL